MKLEAGQIWKYKTRQIDKDSYLLILRIYRNKKDAVVHIKVFSVMIDGELLDIEHVPIMLDVLLDSLNCLYGVEDSVIDYENNIDEWDKADGGVWSVPLDEVIELTEKLIQ